MLPTPDGTDGVDDADGTDGAEKSVPVTDARCGPRTRVPRLALRLCPVRHRPGDDFERLLAEEEEIERRTRNEHHETPHFRKESD